MNSPVISGQVLKNTVDTADLPGSLVVVHYVREVAVIYCQEESCRRCKKYYNGALVCEESDISLDQTGKHMSGGILFCNQYKETEEAVEELHPGREKDGMWPGQIRG